MDKKELAKNRETMLEQRCRELDDKVKAGLRKLINLKNEGSEAEASELIDGLIKDLEYQLEELSNSKSQSGNRPVDRSKFPQSGEILAENELVILKMVSKEEHNSYMDISYECSTAKSAFKDARFKDNLWDSFLSDYAVVTSIYDKKSGVYVGYCSIKDMRKADWEIAIEEKESYRNQGYGYNALKLLIGQIAKLTGQRFYGAQIDIDNTASQKLFKKLGAYPNGISEFLLHGDTLKQFQEENKQFIDENMKAIAEEFGMDPEDMLGHVLDYRIDAKKYIEN